LAACTAKCSASVVFPTPPFCAMIAIVCMSSPHVVEASSPRGGDMSLKL
jgi:hypothetical protein